MTVLPVATRSRACCTKCSDSASRALLERGGERLGTGRDGGEGEREREGRTKEQVEGRTKEQVEGRMEEQK